MRTRSFILSLPAGLFLALALSGCLSGYRLGSTLPPDVRSVYVPIAVNDTEEPLLADELTRALLAQIQRDGSLSIESREAADSVLRVTITDFQLSPLGFEASDRRRVDEYRLRLVADMELVRQSNGKTLARSGGLTGRSDFELVGDLTSGKRRGTPEAAEDLARRIVSAATDAWPDEP